MRSPILDPPPTSGDQLTERDVLAILQLGGAERDGNAELAQQASHQVDRRRARALEVLTDPVQALDALLLGGFHRYLVQIRATCRLEQASDIGPISLVAPHVRPHVVRRQQSHPMALPREPHASLRVLLMALVSTWGAICAFDHAAQLRVLVQRPPERGYRLLATYLEDHGIQFIVSDYWTGYFVAFVTDERVRPLTDFDRIHEYHLAVRANLDRAVEVRRPPSSPCPGGREVAGFLLCPPNLQRPR